jgi:hypothetical protein
MAAFDPKVLVQQFRPFYRLHSEEMWYPCHPEDQLRIVNVVRVSDGSVVIPALRDGAGSPADQILCTPLGIQQLAARGVKLDPSTLARLESQPSSSSRYLARPAGTDFLLQREENAVLPPHGFVTSTNFSPANGTYFHRGAPNNPEAWLGGDAQGYAKSVLLPPAGVLTGAWQEPVTAAWVQMHTVAGVAYVDVIYTAMLNLNGSISLLAGQGEHPNDVETFIVRLNASDLTTPVRYCLQQHGGFSWYEPVQVEIQGGRVVLYLARQSHEVYAHPGRYMRIYGFADDVCDAAGVLWDAPVEYQFRPQGIDEAGVNTDALRCALNPSNPEQVVLIPTDAPGSLWQYVNYLFLALRPSSQPLTDDDFTHQGFPLSTTKWWPSEGPAGTTPPLSGKAAEPSAPGVLSSFFTPVASYLGPNSLPSCAGNPKVRAQAPGIPPIAAPAPIELSFESATMSPTVTGAQIGGPTAALAPSANFVDWRGPIGAYLLGSLNSNLPAWVSALPDTLSFGNLSEGSLTVTNMAVSGLHACVAAPVIAASAVTTNLFITAPLLTVTGTVTVSGAGITNKPVSIEVSNSTVSGVAQLITPVAILPDDPKGWYVPYVGPAPYSYTAQPYNVTQAICSGKVLSLQIAAGLIAVDAGSSIINAILDALIASLKTTLELQVDNMVSGLLNAQITSMFDGTQRVG